MAKTAERDWDIVRDFYSANFNVSPDLVDLMASSDVLLMCVSGASNSSIASTLDIDEEIVSEILLTVLDFDGWKSDLDINPFFIYGNMRTVRNFSFEEFAHDIKISSKKVSDSDVITMFRICTLYYEIEDRIDKEWN